MTESRQLLQHFLAALAYRTQKALRGAPDSFAVFRIGPTSRTSKELVWHMTSVIENVTSTQPEPAAPDAWWTPDAPPRPPGTHASTMADDIS